MGDDHRPNFVLVERGGEQPVGPEREPVLDGRVVGVAAVAGEDRPLDAHCAHAVDDVLPRRLAALRRRQAALEETPPPSELRLVLEREVLARELGMRDDDVLHALRERRLDHCERVLPAEVTGGEDQVVACDRPQHVACLREELPGRIGDLHRLDAEPELVELVLEPRPLGHVVAGLRLRAPRGFGRRVDRRHPDDPRALACGDLDGERIHPSDGAVERQRPDRTHARHGRGDDLRALGGRGVVRLEPEARQPHFGETMRERDVVDPALRHVGSDMDVEVVGSFDELTRPLARSDFLRGARRHRLPSPRPFPKAERASRRWQR